MPFNFRLVCVDFDVLSLDPFCISFDLIVIRFISYDCFVRPPLCWLGWSDRCYMWLRTLIPRHARENELERENAADDKKISSANKTTRIPRNKTRRAG